MLPGLAQGCRQEVLGAVDLTLVEHLHDVGGAICLAIADVIIELQARGLAELALGTLQWFETSDPVDLLGFELLV